MSITVAFTVSSARPGYLERALHSWSRVRGIGSARLVFSCEPGAQHSAILAHAARFGRGDPLIIAHRELLGVAANTRYALETGFVLGGYTIVAEEDVLVSDDILEYHDWARMRYRRSPAVLGVCSFTRASEGEPGGVFRAPFFSPLVWGTWRDRLPRLEYAWGGTYGNALAWDIALVTGIYGKFLFPKRSRSQHIGRFGLHTGHPGWFEGTVSESYADHYPPQTYREVASRPYRGKTERTRHAASGD